jgi:hypothetical protein
LPAIDVPAPRMVSGLDASRHTASAVAISSTCRGRTTTWGGTRYSEASLLYMARVSVLSSTSLNPAARSDATTSWVAGRAVRIWLLGSSACYDAARAPPSGG